MKKLKLGIVGCGYLGAIIADAYADGYLKGYELVGVVSRSMESARKVAEKTGCQACESIEELLALKPDYISEAASVQVVKDIAKKVLENGTNLTVLSIGAFADQEFYDQVCRTAAEHGTRIHIASGAVGGFDVLRTTALMAHAQKQELEAQISTRKGPASLKNTPLFQDSLMTDREESLVFEGSAGEAIALLPTKVNVAVASALSTAGTKDTKAMITSVPGMAGDDHRITAKTDGICAVVDIYSRTSSIAGWSVVALLQNLVSPVMF